MTTPQNNEQQEGWNEVFEAKDCCAKERPPRKVLCQLKKGHKGSHRAVIYWEDE